MVQELLSPQGLRVDGRRHNELRQIQCKLGVLGRFVFTTCFKNFVIILK